MFSFNSSIKTYKKRDTTVCLPQFPFLFCPAIAILSKWMGPSTFWKPWGVVGAASSKVGTELPLKC